MNINATLIVQAVHFGIVYYALRILVLKPAYAFIRQERDAKRLLQERTDTVKQDMRTIQVKRYQMWRAGHNFFTHILSSMRTGPFSAEREKLSPLVIQNVSQKNNEENVIELEAMLVDRLKECR